MTNTGEGSNPGGHEAAQAAIATGGGTAPEPASLSFLSAVAAAEAQTPLPPPPPSPPDASDSRFASAPAAFEAEKQQVAAAAAAFGAAAKARGAAVTQVVSTWLATSPLAMLQELLDQPQSKMPIFKPVVGPAVVMRHEHVIKCLERTDLFTVDPYATEMGRATDDKTKNPQALSHFLLGTDREDLYRLDDVIQRGVMSRHDADTLAALCRQEAEYWTSQARDSGRNEIDVVTTLAKFVPLRLVSDYIGVPYYGSGKPSTLPGLRGGDTFPLDDDLLKVFTFTTIQEATVPTTDQFFGWVKDAFRNAFNNFNPLHPLVKQFRERGLIATENLTAYVHALIKFYKTRLQRGEAVPDTMLTRLLRLQLQVTEGKGHALEEEYASLLGSPIPEGELARRLSDSMIRSNVFGAMVGAVVNPQEATGRIADAMLRLKDGEYEALEGSSYEDATRLARLNEGDPGYTEGLEMLRKYALEALRLRPQGEVLLRLCVQDNTELGGIPIRKGTPVFVAYAAAMRDHAVVPKPLAFNAHRDELLAGYLSGKERAREAPQSLLYLQHGYGRHKCLGRYASELTMRESLRALLRLGRLERRSALEMDEQLLYASSLRIGFF
jgi:cytochrome P450